MSKKTVAPGNEVVEEVEPVFEELDGSAFLIPIVEMYPSHRMRFQKMVRNLQFDINNMDEDKLADLVDYVDEHCVRDRDGWHELNTGEGATERVLTLVFAYVNELVKKA